MQKISESLQSTVFLKKYYYYFTFCSCSAACGISVHPSGIEPVSAAVKCGILTTGLPGKSCKAHLCKVRGKPRDLKLESNTYKSESRVPRPGTGASLGLDWS